MDTVYNKVSDEQINEISETGVCLESEQKKITNRSVIVKDLKVLSLFSGCGGMDLGFEGGFRVFSKSVNEILTPDFIKKKINKKEVLLRPTRFETVFANDIFTDARNAWVHYFAKRGYKRNLFHDDSIVDLVKLHQSGHSVFPEKVDVVTGGFPCQDFSLSGKRNGFNSHKDHNGKVRLENAPSEETRGKLYMWMKQVIEITKPNVFIAENVKGLVNLENIKDLIQQDFSSASEDGYFVFTPQVLHSADYGVPQSRERVIFIGVKKSALNEGIYQQLSEGKIEDFLNPYPKPTHNYNTTDVLLKQFVTVSDVLSGLDEPETSQDPSQQSYSRAKFMGKHCQGQTEVKLGGIAPTIRSEHHGNIEFRRLSEENGGKHKSELASGLMERRLSPRECAIIQTFPLDYEFVIKSELKSNKYVVSPSQAYKIIGNAVPPLLAYNIATRIEELWDIYFKKA